MHLDGQTFSLLLAQKFQQAKTCFQHLQPKFFQWVHHIYLLALCYSEYVYHDIFVIYTSEWKCLCCWLLWEKLVIELSRTWCTLYFHCIDKTWPIVIKIMMLWLDKCLWLRVSSYVLSHGKLSTCTSFHLVDIMYFCLWMLIMGEINVEMKWV